MRPLPATHAGAHGALRARTSLLGGADAEAPEKSPVIIFTGSLKNSTVCAKRLKSQPARAATARRAGAGAPGGAAGPRRGAGAPPEAAGAPARLLRLCMAGGGPGPGDRSRVWVGWEGGREGGTWGGGGRVVFSAAN
jgi:hypothetical protein